MNQILAQLATEIPSRITITICTTKLACSTSETIDMSLFMT